MTDKFVSPEKPPEGLTRELLVILMEECAEVQHRAAKILRFGLGETEPEQPLKNTERLAQEVGDLICVIDKLVARGVMDGEQIREASVAKQVKLAKYLQS